MDISLLNDAQANHTTQEFTKLYNEVFRDFFSRDENLWPVYKDPGFAALNHFRSKHLQPSERLGAFSNSSELHEALLNQNHVPANRMKPTGKPDDVLAFAAALSKDWENPSSVENVITMPSDPAIYGAMMGTLANPNLVYSEYAGMAEQLEKNVVRQIANVVGYDQNESTGLFTQGGTFCNLYGYLLGLRKSLPKAIYKGLDSTRDYRILNSQGGHYSNMTNLSLLGIDITNKTIRIKVTESHEIDLVDLERSMRACFDVNTVVPTIMLTMGTTDTFAIDQVKPVYDLRERLCKEYDIAVKPHIHVDAAVGWSMMFFIDYDFADNPIGINEATLSGIESVAARMRELKYADSFTVDFQKWGYVPYTSSLVMIKNKKDMDALKNDPKNFSYFENDLQEDTHLQSTIECSRGATGLFGAYSALKYMGLEGYQTLIAHSLQNANYMRHQLMKDSACKVVVPENQGPSVTFRLYDRNIVKDANEEFELERHSTNNEAIKARMEHNSEFHRHIFNNRGKTGLYTNWVEFISRSNYVGRGIYSYIPGEKAVFMNPATQREHIDAFLERLYYSSHK